MNADDLSALNDQIAAMARAGLPLDQGLASLAKEMGRGPLRDATGQLARDLQAGHPLPEALARQEGRIPAYYASLVSAGVQSGRLPEVLTTLTTYARTVSTTRATVVASLIYPAIYLVVGMLLLGWLTAFILPQFEAIFHDFGMKLPDFTELVMFFGRNWFEAIVLPAAIVAAGLFAAWAWARSTSHGRIAAARLLYALPLFGPLIRSARLAAFTDLLGMLIENKVPLPTAFRLAGAASSDPLTVERAGELEARLQQGLPLASALRGVGLLPEWVAWLLESGERRGTLGGALREIAALYRRRVDARSGVVRSVFPPFVVIVTAGILTGVFVIALMMPMLKLLEGLSK